MSVHAFPLHFILTDTTSVLHVVARLCIRGTVLKRTYLCAWLIDLLDHSEARIGLACLRRDWPGT